MDQIRPTDSPGETTESSRNAAIYLASHLSEQAQRSAEEFPSLSQDRALAFFLSQMRGSSLYCLQDKEGANGLWNVGVYAKAYIARLLELGRLGTLDAIRFLKKANVPLSSLKETLEHAEDHLRTETESLRLNAMVSSFLAGRLDLDLIPEGFQQAVIEKSKHALRHHSPASFQNLPKRFQDGLLEDALAMANFSMTRLDSLANRDDRYGQAAELLLATRKVGGSATAMPLQVHIARSLSRRAAITVLRSFPANDNDSL